MVDNAFHQMSKETWYKLSFYINIILFFIVAIFIFLLIKDCLEYNRGSYEWINIVRDIAFLSISLALIFFQFFRNLLKIMRRSL